ncbi:Ras GTPase activation domain-containing protein [Planoprotostelium fungivorum]|uniref:Ras GTPase activation domain-containing protein n=1 Tax=Planoprotostelium fungivorum TaxID=1890364 RepID=A0A2P6NKP3_9EUKA|nr:Ras GTPase activation domain-containing protein [Planoprotostelium fungivorum]
MASLQGSLPPSPLRPRRGSFGDPFLTPLLQQMFLEVLFSPNREVMEVICKHVLTAEAPIDFCNAIIEVFDAGGQLTDLLLYLISKEIGETDAHSSSTLFRGATPLTKILSVYFRTKGTDYLKTIIGPTISEVSSLPFTPNSIENTFVDSASQAPSSNVHLFPLIRSLLHRILDDVDICPRPFRRIFYHINMEVTRNLPDMSAESVTGGFFFLRYICSALVSPDNYEITTDRPDINARRNLVQISKILQLLSNGMDATTEKFIQENIETVRRLLRLLSAGSMETVSIQIEPAVAPNLDYYLLVIARSLVDVRKEAMESLLPGDVKALPLKLEEIMSRTLEYIAASEKNKMGSKKEKTSFRKSVTKIFFQDNEEDKRERKQSRKGSLRSASPDISNYSEASSRGATPSSYENRLDPFSLSSSIDFNSLLDSNRSIDISPVQDPKANFLLQVTQAAEELVQKLQEKEDVIQELQLEKRRSQMSSEGQFTSISQSLWLEDQRAMMESMAALKKENRDLVVEVKKLQKQLAAEREARMKIDSDNLKEKRSKLESELNLRRKFKDSTRHPLLVTRSPSAKDLLTGENMRTSNNPSEEDINIDLNPPTPEMQWDEEEEPKRSKSSFFKSSKGKNSK